MKRFRYGVQTAFARAASAVLPCAPFAVVRVAGAVFGWLIYRLGSVPRRIARANLDLAFGDTKTLAEKKWIARRSMQSIATTILTLFWMSRPSRKRLERLADLDEESLAKLREAIARGKGVVLATLHYGNWELLAVYGGVVGLPFRIVVEEMRNAPLEAELFRLRSVTGNQIVAQRGAALKLLKALRRGEVATLLTDQNAPEGGGGDWLEFFGVPAFSNNIAAALAVRTGAALFSCHATPLPGGRFRLVYGPEIPYTVTGDYEADVRRISQQCMTHFEELIREHPEFWLWGYKRWKHRRDLGDNRYPFYTSGAVLPTRKPTSASA